MEQRAPDKWVNNEWMNENEWIYEWMSEWIEVPCTNLWIVAINDIMLRFKEYTYTYVNLEAPNFVMYRLLICARLYTPNIAPLEHRKSWEFLLVGKWKNLIAHQNGRGDNQYHNVLGGLY